MSAEMPALRMTSEDVDKYLHAKLDKGVSPDSVMKYRNGLDCLIRWLGSDSLLTAQRTRAWRQHLESCGYSKSTVQSYVKQVNDFLRLNGRQDLCIPRPGRSDLRGKTFGYLTAIEPTPGRLHGYVLWRCSCKCGRSTEIPSHMLIAGNTTSCGCLNMEILAHRNRYQEGTELRQALEERVINPNSASGYVGVQPRHGKWIAYITYKKTLYRLGTFSSLEDAVKARARAKEAVMEDAARIYEETSHLYGEKPVRQKPPQLIPPAAPEPSILPARRTDNTSGCPGVSRHKGKWAASITAQGYRYRLGTYEELADAICARRKAEELVKAQKFCELNSICTNRK